MLLILLTQTRQFRVLFYCEELYLSKTLYLKGKAIQLAVLTFNNFTYNSPSGFKMCFRSGLGDICDTK